MEVAAQQAALIGASDPVVALTVPQLTAAAFEPVMLPVSSHGRVLGFLVLNEGQQQLWKRVPELKAKVARCFEAAVECLAGSLHSEESEHAQPHEPGLMQIRRFGVYSSIFVDGRYLVKGVAGAVLWKVLKTHEATGRTEFSYREMRLDPSLKLPDIVDNLASRLILLQRRLEEHGDELRIEKIARGRFRLSLRRRFVLVE